MRRLFLSSVVCLVSLVVSAPAASAAGEPFLELGSQSACSSADPAPTPLFKTDDCFEGPCFVSSDCLPACPQAVTATCLSDTCHYTFYTPGGGGGTGGGGTGGGGTDCAEIPCLDSSQCGVCNGRQGACIGDSCRY
jgi:hypothetical protein